MSARHTTPRVSAMRGALATVALALLLGGCASAPPEPERPAVSWEQTFEYPVRFQRIIDEQLLVVGTSRHLFGLDPRTGRQLWRARNVKHLHGWAFFGFVDLGHFKLTHKTVEQGFLDFEVAVSMSCLLLNWAHIFFFVWPTSLLVLKKLRTQTCDFYT